MKVDGNSIHLRHRIHCSKIVIVETIAKYEGVNRCIVELLTKLNYLMKMVSPYSDRSIRRRQDKRDT
jgi:hypothetical protein